VLELGFSVSICKLLLVENKRPDLFNCSGSHFGEKLF